MKHETRDLWEDGMWVGYCTCGGRWANPDRLVVVDLLERHMEMVVEERHNREYLALDIIAALGFAIGVATSLTAMTYDLFAGLLMISISVGLGLLYLWGRRLRP